MIFYKVPITNLRRWTKTSIECLNNHCICDNCYLSKIIKNCHMKNNVLALYSKLGKPEGYKELTFLK